ncbi:MAG: HEAT repeat domain-containing protein [Anaerolineales bacterium]|nr:HEAT repeat domain-containing protein [Anaerolineales bacterium]MDW8279335.1 HEAT repeat domain-containing protein [Anaerolineales bacterium]
MKTIPFSTVLTALQDTSRAFPGRYIEQFSDLSPVNLEAVMQVWPRLPQARKHLLLKRMVERFEQDLLLSFDDLAVRLLEDPDGQVRLYALQLLNETTDTRLLPRLTQMTTADPEPASRARAADLLGQFVMLGELEEISPAHRDQVVNCLLAAARDPDGQIARAALESLGYSSHSEVPLLIESALRHRDPRWQASALTAIGRSADTRWQDQVLEALLSEDQPVRLAAVRAAGQLQLAPARQSLLNMLEDEEDDEVLEALIWSLSLIGGEDVREYIQTLMDDTDDEELLEFLETALLNLDFTEDAEQFNLLAYDEDEPLNRKNGKRRS